ncbi:MAG: deoxyxylulose-5-phosphate synthase, partial [Sedimentibacter sp.]|nr:deoxyxylulose-5-phosphate synthase [Sedimentibacter sp.]
MALYSSFLQRAYDQVIHDVAIQNLHVVLAVDRSGLVGNDGETHQGVFDESFLMQIPNMTVMSPADYRELESMLEFAVNEINGPVAIRYPRGNLKEYVGGSYKKIEKGHGVVAEEGCDVTIAACGKMVVTALHVREILKKQNIDAEVINLRFIKPLDKDLLIKSVMKTKKAVVIDEAVPEGSFAVCIKAALQDHAKVLIKTLPDEFIR